MQTKGFARIMAVTVPRENWTDQRLGDLNKKVDDGFSRVDKDFRELRAETNARFDKLEAKLDRLNWGLLAFALGIVGSMIGNHAL